LRKNAPAEWFGRSTDPSSAVERHHELFAEYPSGVAANMGPKKQMLHPGKDEFDGLVDEFEDKVQYLGVPGRLRDFGEALMSTFQSGRASRARFPA